MEGRLRDNEVRYEQVGNNLRLIEDLAADLAASKELGEEDSLGSVNVYKSNYIQMLCKLIYTLLNSRDFTPKR